MLPFRPLSQAARTTLDATRLTGTGQQVVGQMSAVAYLDVPLGHLFVFRGGDNFRFYLKGAVEVGIAGGTPAGPLVIDLAAQGVRAVRTPRTAVDLPAAYVSGPGVAFHPDFVALTSADGGTTWLPAAVLAFDPVAQTVTVQRPGNATRVRVYYVPGEGEFQLRAVRAMGSDRTLANLYANSLRAVHETDQNNARSAPTFGSDGMEYPLPPQFRLELAVRAASKILWDQYAQHELMLPMYDGQVQVTDAGTMAAQAEVKLRGGAI
jgi:hypothetical protein